jgi:hypothetical protein
MLLSMVALEFTVARDLPRIGHGTFLDAVFLASFAFCFLHHRDHMQEAGMRGPAVKLHCAEMLIRAGVFR